MAAGRFGEVNEQLGPRSLEEETEEALEASGVAPVHGSPAEGVPVPESAGVVPLAANQGVGAVVTMLAAGLLRQPWVPRDRTGRRAVGWAAVGGPPG